MIIHVPFASFQEFGYATKGGTLYNTIAFMSDAVDGRSAARCRNTIAVRQNVTFLQI